MELKGKRALVVGMAKSGIASVDLLVKHGADVRATDLNPPAQPLAVPFDVQTPEVFRNAELIVLSPGV